MKSEVVPKLPFFLFIFSVKIRVAETVDCSPVTVANKLTKCNILALSITANTPVVRFHAILSSYCDSLECNIACRESIERPCLSQGVVVDDLKAKRTAHRYMCANKDEYVRALQNCRSYNYYSCSRDLQTTITDAVNQLKLSPNDYSSYINKYCTAVRNFRTCEQATPWETEYSCTADMAAIINNVADVSFSLDVCNIPKSNHLFNTTYARPVDSNIVQTCGGISQQPTHLVLLAVLQSLFVLLKNIL